MTTRASMNDHINEAEEAVKFALEQLKESRRQEHYNQTEYSKAQLMLEDAHNSLDTLMMSSNTQQKERIRRMQLQIRHLQNDMILDEVDIIDIKD